VVIHGDPHLYNIFASEGGRLSGLIDFGDCGIGDRHEDLRYVHSEGPEFAKMAIAAYQEQAGVELEEDRVARFHVRSALDHFVWIPPTGERFPEIVEWATAALNTLTPEWT
jgi:aminoglycoside phosphotransferase